MLKKKRNVTESTKKRVAGKQNYKCNNKPGRKLKGLRKYSCPLWKDKKNPGSFDESGYEIDHIVEHCLSHDDSESNLQALCVSCHRVKTKRFVSGSRKNTNNSITNTTNSKTNTIPIPIIIWSFQIDMKKIFNAIFRRNFYFFYSTKFII